MTERPRSQPDAASPLPPHPDKVPLQIDMFTGELIDTRSRAQKRRDWERYQLKQLPMFDSGTEADLMRTQWKPLTMTTRSGKPLELSLMMEDPRTGEEIEADRMRAAEEQTYSYLTEPELATEVDEQASVSAGETMAFPSGAKLDLVQPDGQPQMMAVKLFGDVLLPIWSSRDEALEVLEGHWGDHRAYAVGEGQIEIHDQSSTGCFLITYSSMGLLEDVEWVDG